MIAKRPEGAAPALQGVAEALPLDDKSVDAAMAIFTIHHWSDLEAGLAEYFPEAMALEEEAMPSIASLEASLPGAKIEAVPMPSRCRDEFTSALWDRPELFLEPATLRASSLWHRLDPEVIERGQERLRADLESGRWDEVHGHLRTHPELDIGTRLISEEL